MGMGRNLSGRSSLGVLLFLAAFNLCGQESFVPRFSSVEKADILFSDNRQIFFPLPENKIVNDTLLRYQTNWAREYLSQISKRSNLLRYTISYQLWDAKIPQELMNLPVIESGWDPRSLSSSGAFGIWQFMTNSIPSSFVLDRWRDDRGDIYLSTEAAISKFNFNLDKTEGDWLLALAGYNCGINLITRSLEKSSGSDYWALRDEGFLPKQTEEYIPRFLVVNYLLNHKVTYQIPLSWEKSPYWLAFPAERTLFLPALAETLEMDLEDLLRGNGELKDWLIPLEENSYTIKIPSDRIELFSNRDRGVIPKTFEADSITNQDEALQSHRLYLVQEGDTLWKIAAEQHCSPEELQVRNGITDPRELLPGMLLYLP